MSQRDDSVGEVPETEAERLHRWQREPGSADLDPVQAGLVPADVDNQCHDCGAYSGKPHNKSCMVFEVEGADPIYHAPPPRALTVDPDSDEAVVSRQPTDDELARLEPWGGWTMVVGRLDGKPLTAGQQAHIRKLHADWNVGVKRPRLMILDGGGHYTVLTPESQT